MICRVLVGALSGRATTYKRNVGTLCVLLTIECGLIRHIDFRNMIVQPFFNKGCGILSDLGIVFMKAFLDFCAGANKFFVFCFMGFISINDLCQTEIKHIDKHKPKNNKTKGGNGRR